MPEVLKAVSLGKPRPPSTWRSNFYSFTGFTKLVKPVKDKQPDEFENTNRRTTFLKLKTGFMLAQLKTVNHLASFLGIGVRELKQLKPQEHYVTFEVKKEGSDKKRTIEAPTGIMRNLLDRLSDGLQWLYSDHRTDAAQGYIRSVTNDPDKRTIFTNATKHLGKKYLLNIDLESFFYQIDERKVAEIFSDVRFFAFEPEAVELLSELVCYKGRLPMGSSTSPALSNFATIDLDIELSRWTKAKKITYTRFVDDLSFSSNLPLKPDHFEMIGDMLQMHRFKPNPNKIKWYGPDDVKEVTGLIVGKTISLPPEYLVDLKHEFFRLKAVREYALQYPDYTVLEWIQKLERMVAGRLAFVKAVYGGESETYRGLLDLKAETDEAEPEIQSLSWRYSGYEFFTS
jgi:RNA-directed DNA polymerase